MRYNLLICFLLLSCQRYESEIPIEREANKVLTSYAQEVAIDTNLQLLSVKHVTSSMYVHYCMAFTSDKNITIAEGKKLIQPIVVNFLQKLNNDPTIQAYGEFCERGEIAKQNHFALPPRPANTAVKIAFWNHEMDRPKAPYLAEILFQDGSYHYYEADPETQALKLVLEEPYTAGE
ncbi:MAG: hypothetical protein JSS12_06635 [Verrucomicrobia bacterium]|nr:hypothetical protein [Verrucomicrobiota bacterium]